MSVLNSPLTTLTTPYLIGDNIDIPNGASDGLPNSTEIGGVKVAAFEVQSTTGGFLPPRMTSAQFAAIPLADGNMAYLTDINQYAIVQNGAIITFKTGNSFFNGTLTKVQIEALYTTPVQILPAIPGYAYIINFFGLQSIFNTTAFTAGGALYLTYGSHPHDPTTGATTNIPATVINAGASSYGTALNSMGAADIVTKVAMVGAGIYLTNDTAVFATGDGTAAYDIDYSLTTLV